MVSSETFVIVGGGLAGAKAAEALHDSDFDGQVVLFAEEEHLPYERPPLSKEYLAGKKTLSDFTVHNSDWYHDHDVDLRLATRVTALDPAAHTVGLPDGTTVHYDKLLLATGSASKRPPIPGSDAAGVHYLRTYDDAVALNSVLAEGSSLAVVGAGWIGLEVAAAARQRGVDVTVVHMPALNTPQFGWVKSRLRNKAQPVPPIFEPEVGARAVYWAARHKRAEIYVGHSTVEAIVGNKIAPRVLDRYLGRTGYASQQTSEPEDPDRRDNLWGPLDSQEDRGTHGNFDTHARRFSYQLWADFHRPW